MFIIGIVSWTSGNFSKLTTPYDPDGKGCGVDHPDHPFIYFASPHVGVCITNNIVIMENSLRKIVSVKLKF